MKFQKTLRIFHFSPTSLCGCNCTLCDLNLPSVCPGNWSTRAAGHQDLPSVCPGNWSTKAAGHQARPCKDFS
ncbi:unnamed protein product [Prunus armeniaca]